MPTPLATRPPRAADRATPVAQFSLPLGAPSNPGDAGRRGVRGATRDTTPDTARGAARNTTRNTTRGAAKWGEARSACGQAPTRRPRAKDDTTRPERPERPMRSALPGYRLVRDASYPLPAPCDARPVVCAPADVFALMAPVAKVECVEVLWILPLDSQHRVTVGGPIAITRGLLNASLVHPREVFRAAICANAVAIIVCHNHPSGDPTPSPDDRAVTDQLRAAGRLLDIPVHDHVIIGAGRYTSFAEAGLL